MVKYEAVVVGASSGGWEALAKILQALPADFPLPIIVAQHLHPLQDTYYCESLDGESILPVREAGEKEAVSAGHVYIAPPNYHLLIERDRTFSLSVDERVNYSRPSIDVLFESAADVYSAALVGIILSGANQDGAQGLRRIKEHFGLTIVQDPVTAYVDYMPRAALAAGPVDYILPLDEIGPFLAALATASDLNKSLSPET